MEKNCNQISKLVSDLEDGLGRSTSPKAKEKLTLFKLTSAALVKVSLSLTEGVNQTYLLRCLLVTSEE